MSASRTVQALVQKARYIKKHAIPFVRRICIDYVRTRRLWRRKRHNGAHNYTVVSAVYNVEKYLDDYFTSLTGQILDFTRHITLILVDDGSTDSSAAIIKRWQRRFPNNIIYLYKENGGQGSARNLGMDLVKTPWVTFIDPDDFVDVMYFQHVDAFLQKHHADDTPDRAVQMLSCNFIVYYEHSGRFFNKHHLRSRFQAKETLISCADMSEAMQLSVNSVFFPIKEIRRQNLRSDERRWPEFEDAHFVLRYLQNLTAGSIAYAQRPKYYYRKRRDNSSSLSTSLQKKGYYIDILREAYQELLEHALARFGSVPLYVQRILLYAMSFRIKGMVNQPIPPVLNEAEKEECFVLCCRFFAHIDTDIILNAPPSFGGLGIMHKAGILSCFKALRPPPLVAVEHFDPVQRELCLVYFCGEIPHEEIRLDGVALAPIDAKSTRNSLLGKLFIWRRQLWVRLPSLDTTLTFLLDGLPATLSLGNNKEQYELSTAAIAAHEATATPIPKSSRPYTKTWLLMDRDISADDNAEHLYRYIQKNNPEQPIFFALSANSADWRRLQADGFKLLAFGSPQHEKVLRGCAALISSHADKYVTDYFPALCLNKKFVFLQHGVTKDNISAWLNQKKIDLFVTATSAEYESIVADGSPYFASKRNVVLTGFPRHDALILHTRKHEKTILIMPTWRNDLMGEAVGKTNARLLRNDFINSQYACLWGAFLRSPQLYDLAAKHGMRTVFFPHMNVQPYLTQFELPAHVETLTHTTSCIQDLFRQATVLVTDYSSVAFEMGFLQKAVLYYQFDSEAIFSGTHLTQKGYYNYRSDGFGPVAVDQETLLIELENILATGGQPATLYQQRMEATFSLRDGKNCERVYMAIKRLVG